MKISRKQLAAVIVIILVISGVVGILTTQTTFQRQTSAVRQIAPGAPAPLPAAEIAVAPIAESSVGIDSVGRKVISRASLSIGVRSIDQTVQNIRTLAEGLGGFVAQESTTGQNDEKFATVTIRVPQESFLLAIDRIEQLGRTINKDLQSQDVTEQFIDLEARLNNARIAEQRLATILGRADRVVDILEIERELSRVRLQIEQIQGQLTFLERRIELSTISVSLTEEDLIAPPEFNPFLAAVATALVALSLIAQGLIVIVIVVGPFAVAAVVIYSLYKRRRSSP